MARKRYYPMNKRKAPTGPVKFVNAIFALVFANVVLANSKIDFFPMSIN